MVDLFNGNNIDVLKGFEDNSIDSIVTDPPYGLKFMGKKWDYDVPSVELWQECLRVLKPGGHLLAACGTRTQHRMATNIEDAGFEIRDLIAWIYGSGFPKSLNIGKQISKLKGEEREIIGTETIDTGIQNGSMHSGRKSNLQVRNITKGTSVFEGWGTALKPAMELWTMARKPISEKNIAENVLRWRTGGINIDGCRVPTGDDTGRVQGNFCFDSTINKSNYVSSPNSLGRFPANLIHDGSEEVVAGFPESESTGGNGSKFDITKRNALNKNSLYPQIKNGKFGLGLGDSGSASRFFYTAKAHSSERNYGLEGFEEKPSKCFANDEWTLQNMSKQVYKQNHHPTVKPLDLMQYLVRLVTPKGGVCLDAFMGSGTTGMACKLEHFDFIGIELETEYFNIAKARIDAVGEVTEIKQTNGKLF